MMSDIKDLLSEMLSAAGFTYTKIVVAEEESGAIRANIESDEAAFLIGMHGERVNAIQYLLKSILWSRTGEKIFVIVDVDGYKYQREMKFIAMADEKIEGAIATNYQQSMPPLEPYMRKIIHMHILKTAEGRVTTESEGEGTARRVIIKPIESV